jgi:hypothetical protein
MKRGFRLPTDRLTLSATSVKALSPVPTTVRATLTDPNWHRIKEEEFTALIASNTCDLVPCPVSSNIVTDKRIFKHTFNSDGTLEWYKARWVVRDFTQRHNVDYDETFNPVVKPATAYMMLSLAVSRSWPVHRLDVKNTFMYDIISETIYCSQPTEFIDPAQPDWVCLLN